MERDLLIYYEERYGIARACFEVYNRRGCGFLKDGYQERVTIKFETQDIPFLEKPKQELACRRRRRLNRTCDPGVVCYGSCPPNGPPDRETDPLWKHIRVDSRATSYAKRAKC